jgi:hypothetical protein
LQLVLGQGDRKIGKKDLPNKKSSPQKCQNINIIKSQFESPKDLHKAPSQQTMFWNTYVGEKVKKLP